MKSKQKVERRKGEEYSMCTKAQQEHFQKAETESGRVNGKKQS